MPKRYWIYHVEETINQDAFDRYVTKVNALIQRGEDPIAIKEKSAAK